MGVTACQHRDLSLFGIAAVEALNSQDTLFGSGCLLGHLAAAENMYVNIDSFAAVISADEPVLLGIESDFGRIGLAVSARSAVVFSPFAALGTDAVAASVAFGSFCAAIHTQAAIGTGLDAVFTASALAADSDAVGTNSFTAYTYLCSAIGTESALFAHQISAVGAFSAIGAVYIGTFRTFSAVIAPHIGAAFADISAFAADRHAVSALSAPFTESILSRTFDTHVTGHTEGITACRTFFAALGTDVGTVGAAFAAGTGRDAFAAFLAVCAPAVRA